MIGKGMGEEVTLRATGFDVYSKMIKGLRQSTWSFSVRSTLLG